MLVPLLPLLAFLPALVRCGQAPVVETATAPANAATPIDAPERVRVPRPKIINTAGILRVTENSGVCETTPNVYQASGYADLTPTDSMWFWFFAARNNPDTAPLTLWFNGGPGSSSMVALFQEHGPCRITNDSSTVVLNPYSWNNESNIIYIDQPIGTGFSHGNYSRVRTSQGAAEDVWAFMQIFLGDSRFAKYQNRELAIWTESYGGHYGPTFASHFLDQNAAIANKTLTGIPLNLQVLAIGNGLIDPLSQYPGYAEYAANNPYRVLGTPELITAVNGNFSMANGCQEQITACYNNVGNGTICSQAQAFCNAFVMKAFLGTGISFNEFFVPAPSNDLYPPGFAKYLSSVSAILGVDPGTDFVESGNGVSIAFSSTGDWMTNTRPLLENVINAGIRTLIYDGDADFVFNYVGVEAMVDNLNTTFTAEYQAQQWQNYTVDGQIAGQFKQAGNFTYIRVYGAGHEVPAYKYGNLQYGQAAAQMFREFTITPTSQNVTIPTAVTKSTATAAAKTSMPSGLMWMTCVFSVLLSGAVLVL